MEGEERNDRRTDTRTHTHKHSKAPLFQAADWENTKLKGNFKQWSPVIPLKYILEVLIPSKGCDLFNSNNL